jgi:hypothetical protein
MADDNETWGKSSARSRRATMRKESPNGWRSRRLTGGKGWRRLTSASGKQGKMGWKLWCPGVFIAGGERERLRARSSTSGRRRLAGPAGPWCESPSTVPGH